jgi:hypothetical protein
MRLFSGAAAGRARPWLPMLVVTALVACSEFVGPKPGDEPEKPHFAAGGVCHVSGNWQNFAMPAQTGSFTVLFEATPDAINIDAMTGLSSGPAGVWSDQAVVVRFGTTGVIQALNGSTWSAVTSIPYSAGVTYRIRLVVNIPAHTYSAYVAPVGGNEKTLATNYAFRPETNTVTNLDHWHTRAYTGSHEVCDFTAATNSSNTSGNWTNFPLGTQTGSFWAEFDGTPDAANIDAMTGFSSGAAAAWSDQAVVVRFGPTGVIQALNGSAWNAVTAVPYSATTIYHFRLFVDVTSHTYSAYVRPAGGTEVTLASNYSFRPETNTVTSLDQWHTRAYSGSHQTSNFIASGGGGGGGGGGTPTVTTTAASAVRTTSATLNGSGNPNGANTTGWFRYWTTSPGSCNDNTGTRSPSTGGISLGSGTAAVAYNRGITNLTGGTVYYFCAIASNSAGTALGTVQSFRAGGVGLRFGLGGNDTVGIGPGGDFSGPTYGLFWDATPELGTIDAKIAEADQKDVVLLVAPSRGRGGWAPGGQFSWAAYEAKVREFQNDTMFRRAVNQRRVLLYVVDEPNHTTFGGTISPTDVNQMGLLHKEIWPGAITFVRMAGGPLRDGWDDENGVNQPPPAGGYTGLDYGWLQYSAQRTDSTFTQVYTAERAILAGLNMGMVPGLNWWAGGIGHHGETTWDGVTACWQIDYPSSRLGYIVGIDQPAPHPPSEGDRYDCGQLPAAVTRTVVSPAWFRRWADVVFSDTEAPFAPVWRSADDSQTIPGAEALSARGDFVSALDYVITKTGSRTTWNGYRTPK